MKKTQLTTTAGNTNHQFQLPAPPECDPSAEGGKDDFVKVP